MGTEPAHHSAAAPRVPTGSATLPAQVIAALMAAGAQAAEGAPPLTPAQVDLIVSVLRSSRREVAEVSEADRMGGTFDR